MAPLVDDLRNGLRSLIRRPGFTAAAILLLSLGAGAMAAVFTLVDAYLLRPLPFAGAERMVVISQGHPASRERNRLAPDHVFLIEAEARSFDLTATYVTAGRIGFDLGGGDHPDRVQGGAASASFFTLLGARPVLGRTFSQEDEAGGDPVVVLSHDLWKRRFAGDPGVIGQKIDISGTPRKVIGVLPSGFGFSEAEIWVPQPILLFQAKGDPVPTTYGALMLARLRQGVTLDQARDEISRLGRGLENIDPYGASKGITFHVVPLRDFLLGELRVVIWVLFGSVVLVLLITCTNVSNLLLGRLMARQPELTLRSALGASRRRVARQLLFECLFLGLGAGLLGLWVGKLALDLLIPLATPLLPRGEPPRFDLRALACLLVAATACGVLSGVGPILRRTDRLADSTPTTTGLRRQSLWGLLVVGQLALSLVLLAGEGLMIRSFQALTGRDLGFDSRNVLTFDVFLSKNEYASNHERLRFLEQVSERLAALPGALSAGVTTGLPIEGGGSEVFILTSEGQEQQDLATLPMSDCWHVSPSLFRTLAIRLRAGRFFTDRDDESSPPVVIVDEDLARRFWPGEPALGKRLRIGRVWREVVGITGKVATAKPHMNASTLLYMPLAQLKLPTAIHHFAIRTRGNPLDSSAAVLATVRELNPDQTVYAVTTMEARVEESTSRERLVSLLLGLFAALGLSLALSGLFAVVRFAMLNRRREVGIRIALGANRGDILKLVLLYGLRLIGLGLALGAVLASFASQALARLVYGVAPGDPATLASAALALGFAALVAALLPGLAILRSNPVLAIRSE